MNDFGVISAAQALEQTHCSLGVKFETDAVPPSRPLIAQSLRRAVFNTAPCPAQTLRSLVFAALSPFTGDAEALKVNIEETLEDVIAMGDILEMRTDLDGRRDVVLRPAPPAFVGRRDGTFIILGVAGDEITPAMQTTVVHQDSGLRCIRPDDTQTCRNELLDLGLIELSERLWLFVPAQMSAIDVLAHWKGRLPVDAKPETVEGLEILNGASATTFYKGRWSGFSAQHSGTFVGRRPQRYGSKLWCLAEVMDGVVLRLVDIRAKDSRTRDCDEAWRLQAAIDAAVGTPQAVRVSANGSTSILAFSAPLPAWAARRLSFIGKPVSVPRSLLAFEIPQQNVQDELRWLGENLWLARKEKGEAE